MIVKVCGIKTLENINDISHDIDMVGLNFYKPSIRFVDQKAKSYKNLPKNISKTGVFVNESLEFIQDKINDYDLDLVQLHGNETYNFGIKIASIIKVIKVFRIRRPEDFDSISNHDYQTLNLLDYHSVGYGGAGIKFDWNMLSHYKSKLPFILSGGIGQEDINAIKAIKHPKFIGVDINSKFEASPGIKDMRLVTNFVTNVKTQSKN